MKKLLKGMFIFITMSALILILIPVLLITIMFKNDAVPYEELKSGQGFDYAIKESIDGFLAGNQGTFTVEMEQAQLNSGIFSMIKRQGANITGINQHYLDDDSLENQYLYNFEGTNGVKGIYSELDNNYITLKIPADYTIYNFFTMKTTISMKLMVVVDENYDITLQIEHLNIGNFPALSLSGIADFVLKTTTGESLNEMLTNAISYGSFDLKSKTYKLTFNEYNKFLTEAVEESGDLVNLLLDVLIQQKLFSVGIDKDKVYVNLDFGKVIAKQKDPFAKYDNEGLQKLLDSRISMLFFSAINSPDDKILFNLTQDDLNGFISTKFDAQFSSDDKQTFDIFDETYSVGFNEDYPVYFSFNESSSSISVELELKRESTQDSFATEIIFDAILELSDNKEDILISISNVRLGELSFGDNAELEEKVFSQVFDLMRNSGMVINSDNKIVLEGICTELVNNSGTTLSNVYISNAEFVLELEVTEGSVVGQIQDKMEDILDVLNNDSIIPLDDLSNTMTNEEFKDRLQSLTPEEQLLLYEIVYNELINGDNAISQLDLDKLLPQVRPTE